MSALVARRGLGRFSAWMKDDRAELQYQVGQRLRLAVDEIMSREAITKTEVARRTHTTLGKLNNWIRGDNFPDPLFVVRLYDLFGVTADWLYLDKLPGLPSSLRTRIADVETESRAAKPAARRRASQKRY
jgi:transcriptional regulator with XRE-family HTH domain